MALQTILSLVYCQSSLGRDGHDVVCCRDTAATDAELCAGPEHLTFKQFFPLGCEFFYRFKQETSLRLHQQLLRQGSSWDRDEEEMLRKSRLLQKQMSQTDLLLTVT
ncbi:uncharacterized protein LOC124354925 [Homalodisca vitripennis]|uniref:uncharacterized protein LOC124354925 n=1 Tax=Homalodisca vitripennis TaxID=197043 RepID=UPI001EEBAD93|nr:uncharacterized protein LOC124354925 [Homalodisca vitripennis]